MRRRVLPLLFALLLPLAAHADILQTTLTGPGVDAIFPLYGETIPGTYFPRGFEFDSEPLNVIGNGAVGFAGLTFYDPTQHNGVDLVAILPFLGTSPPELIFDGPMLLSPFGFTSVLNPGVYDLTTGDGTPYVLTVTHTPDSSSVPEPASWTLVATSALFLYLFRSFRRTPANTLL